MLSKRWIAAFAIAGVSDLVDFFLIGDTPLLGDLLDAITALLLWLLVGTCLAAAGIAEVTPYSDILPLHTVAVLLAYRRKMEEEGG